MFNSNFVEYKREMKETFKDKEMIKIKNIQERKKDINTKDMVKILVKHIENIEVNKFSM